ncbi:MAG TPA: tetratricopeptide repeat protein [Planctomycetia bacterium]|nr:tetratricopeptide repeat protein [Planctomycetia bacterium]
MPEARSNFHALALVAVVAVCFFPSLRGGWFWDDSVNLERNPTLAAPDGYRRIWTDPRASYQYYPLTYSAWKAIHDVAGPRPQAFLAANLILHAVNVLLAWKLLSRIIPRGAWLAALLFGISPLQVETVGWATELKNVLSTFWALLAALAWDSWAERGGRGHYATGFACFALALASKTVVASLAPCLILWEWARRPETWRRKSLWLIPWFALALGAGATTVWRETLVIDAATETFMKPPPLAAAERIQLAGMTAWHYVGRMIEPLKPVIPIEAMPVPNWGSPNRWAGIVAAVALVFATGWFAGRKAVAALLAYGFLLAPASGLLPFQFHCHSYVADHFQYLACLPLFALFAAAIGRAPRFVRDGLEIVAISNFAVFCFVGAREFADREATWRRNTELNPSAWAAPTNWGETLMLSGRNREAAAAFEEAVKRRPDNLTALVNLGMAYSRDDRLAEAERIFVQATSKSPNHGAAWHLLGDVRARSEKWKDAAAAYERAVEIMPDNYLARWSLGTVYRNLGRDDDANREFEAARHLDPRQTLSTPRR